MAAKILIVDDEELIRWSLSEDLKNSGYSTITAEDVKDALELVDKESPDLILTDLRLRVGTGLDVLKDVRKRQLGIPVVLMTAFADLSSAVEALREGAADYISKPLQMAGLKITLKRVLETADLKSREQRHQQKKREKYSFDSIVAASPAMRAAVATARKIVASPHGTILILGDSGVGKDRLARAIHYESSRAEHPLMEISCTAIPGELLESELFGYENGAFTGANKKKKGLFEAAAGGTVFLNEVGHMPAPLQAKILRVLEDKTFKRVGGTEDISVDVRVIAATNEDLERAVAENKFRTDLYYRINVLTIKLLPLKRRKEDILPLIGLMMGRMAAVLRKPLLDLPESTRRAMVEYDWPGNVRELRNVLERMMILGETRFKPAGGPPAPPPARPGAAASVQKGSSTLASMEKTLIEEALERSGGSQQKAARELGISRDALRRRIEKFNLRP